MNEAYGKSQSAIIDTMQNGGKFWIVAAMMGVMYQKLASRTYTKPQDYYGLEWNESLVKCCNDNGINAKKHDLNKPLPFSPGMFQCVVALSVLEHLLFSSRFMQETYRVLDDKGTLVLLTPNISTLFTIVQLILGKMPSSGPHPDSLALLNSLQKMKVKKSVHIPDVETDNPLHRHLIIFSFRVLKLYLKMIGFTDVSGYGFGNYPFPIFMQPMMEKIDPYHCHQMVFIARKQLSAFGKKKTDNNTNILPGIFLLHGNHDMSAL